MKHTVAPLLTRTDRIMISQHEAFSFDDVLLVPKKGFLHKRRDADLATRLFEDVWIDIPILSANMPSVTEGKMAKAMADIGAMGVIHRFMSVEDQLVAYNSADQDAIVAVGLKDEDRFETLYEAGVRWFCFDVAHAHHEAVGEALSTWLDSRPEARLMVGNVATPEGAFFLKGFPNVSAIKVGIGPGAACATRERTGCGYPQLSAIIECAQVAGDIPIVADGGIKNSGDIVKALAAGASTVMLGKLLARADEAPYPGEYFGNASARLNGHRAPEGAEGEVPVTGPVKDIIKELCWGIRSGISYGGGTNIKELQDNAEFVRVAPGVQQESQVRL